MIDDDEDEVTVVNSDDFQADPARYLANIDKRPIRIVSTTSKLTVTIMGLAEPRKRSPS